MPRIRAKVVLHGHGNSQGDTIIIPQQVFGWFRQEKHGQRIPGVEVVIDLQGRRCPDPEIHILQSTAEFYIPHPTFKGTSCTRPIQTSNQTSLRSTLCNCWELHRFLSSICSRFRQTRYRLLRSTWPHMATNPLPASHPTQPRTT